MADYNLGALSYLEFELLIRDLLQEEWEVPLESFKSGKDKGIDIRYIDTGTTIIQCKHFFESSYANLKSHLNKEEKEKVEKLKPERYILATSVELSPDRKEELKDIFYPFCKKDSDILGREDILNFLNRHEKIVKRHYKLWFPGTFILKEVLEKVIHSELYARTEVDLQEFQKIIPKIAISKSFKELERNLDEHNVVVICGNPGSGKTTMMKFFVLNYVKHGYQPTMITDNIDAAFKILKTEEKQVFYYDDFLGQTFFEKNLSKNEDNQILLFIKSIENQKNKKFFLSTREYVLKQAEAKFETIKDVEDYKYIINCSDFSQEEKAKILYNHLWHSQISIKNIENLLEDKNYLKIIQHRNFNPRLIETMTNLKRVNCENFVEEFINSLDNPSEVWKDVFEHKISAEAQTIVLIMGTFSYSVSYNSLWECYKFFYSIASENLDPFFYRSFKEGLSELHDTFIKSRKSDDSTIFFDFNNPSIRDFIQNYLLSEKIIMTTLCERAIYFSQLEQIWDILQYGYRNNNINSAIIKNHIDTSTYLKTIERIMESNSEHLYPFFENMTLHLLRVTFFLKDPQYQLSLNKKIKLLIQRNYDGKTTQIDTLYSIIILINKNKDLFLIENSTEFNELLQSAKIVIQSQQPKYISDFKLIQNYVTHLGVEFDTKEINLLKYRLNLILDEGIQIDDDFAISTYDPDEDIFNSIGFNIEGLEELENDLVIISPSFGNCVNDTLEFVRGKIFDYYESLNQPDDENDKIIDIDNKSDISSFQSDNEIDTLFESLRNK